MPATFSLRTNRYTSGMRARIWILLLAMLLSACGLPGNGDVGPVPEMTPPPTSPAEALSESADPGARRNRRVDDDTDYRISRNLPLDAIPPIYDPEFVSAAQSPLEPDELILGVAWDGEAKAYPISVLRIREMVNDELAGIPTLVTW